jgi:ketosteroid isomerase-like protein
MAPTNGECCPTQASSENDIDDRIVFTLAEYDEQSHVQTRTMNEGQTYAARWIDAWNSMDLDRALELWSEEIEFCSPLAAEITGSPVLRGKAAVGEYWGRALAQAARLRFELIEALWDDGARTVTIVYRRARGADVRVAAEIIRLNEKGLGAHGIALHGASLSDAGANLGSLAG